MKKKQYWERRSKGLCIECQKPIDDPQFARCSECRRKNTEYEKNSTIFYKGYGICTRCGKEKAELGKTMCWRCAEIKREYVRKYNNTDPEVKKERAKETSRELYHRRISKGLCGRCGKRKIAKNSTSRCIDCLLKNRRASEKSRKKNVVIPRDERYKHGLCYICGEPYEPNDTKVCDKCRERQRENALKQDKTKWLATQRWELQRIFRKNNRKGD